MEVAAVLPGGGSSVLPGARELGTFETDVDYSACGARGLVGEGGDEAGERVLDGARENEA